MSRVARWRRRTGDPTSLRGWLVGNETFVALGKDEATQRNARLVLCGCVVYLVLGAVLIFGFPKVGSVILPFVNCCIMVPVLVSSARRKPPPDEDPYGPGESLLVQASVRNSGGMRTGGDIGRLISSEGWLLFEGERTSFAVTRGEAYEPRYGETGLVNLEDGRSVLFSAPDAGVLERVLTDWSASPVAEGEAVLPPVEIHPGIWVERWTMTLTGALIFFIVAGFGLAFGFPLAAALASVGLVACLGAAGGVARRLGKELPRALEGADPALDAPRQILPRG